MVALPEQIKPSPTIDAIEAAVVAGEKAHPARGYIGGSAIGNPCERALWYDFRFAFPKEAFSGRMLRLFGHGHVEEDRMVKWLRDAGLTVTVEGEPGEQIAVKAVDGHFGGHLDGEVEGVLEAPKTKHVLECKTHNSKSFAQLQKHGVAVAKPVHVAQMQVYMHLRGVTRALYMAENKDNSELYIERVEYDAAHAIALLVKAERIKDATAAPARINEDPTSFSCRFCGKKEGCHNKVAAQRGCRTCIHAAPYPGGVWHCGRWLVDLTIEEQHAGCEWHLYLPSLVGGEQTDVDEKAETVTYLMDDGSDWTDGADRVVSS